MKKLLLAASGILLFSCSSNEELETKKLSEEKIAAFEKASKEKPSSTSVTLKCGSSSYINPISINPNYPYISNYQVMYKEGTPLYGRNQIYLDRFIGQALFPASPFTSGPTIYYGYGAAADFANDPSNFSSYQELSYGQDADNASYYGDIFPYDQPMTNDAANTVYHYFKAYMYQSMTPVAVHIYTESYLCIPAAKGIRIKVRYN